MKRDRAVGEADCCQAGGVEQRGTGLAGSQTVHRCVPNDRNAEPQGAEADRCDPSTRDSHLW